MADFLVATTLLKVGVIFKRPLTRNQFKDPLAWLELDNDIMNVTLRA